MSEWVSPSIGFMSLLTIYVLESVAIPKLDSQPKHNIQTNCG